MKTLRHCTICFLLSTIIFNTFTGCSSDDSDNKITKLNILVLDSGSQEPIAGALIEVCNNAYFCTNILASGTTNANGKISLSFLTSPDKVISESFTVYKDNYISNTSILDQLDLSQEIVVYMKMY